MALSATLLTLILPLLASCQSAPINITGFGTGIPSDSNALEYYNAIPRSGRVSGHSFQGFQLNVTIDNTVTVGDPDYSTNSTQPWTLLLNYDTLQLPTDSGNVTTVNTQFALAFPQQQWPINDTDWQLCASMLLDDLPASISNKKENNTSADCGQYLGEACMTAWLEAYRSASAVTQIGCPSMPSLQSIKECASQIGQGSESIGTGGPISNATESGLVYYSANSTYINPRTRQQYNSSTVPYEGLSWGQWFAYRRTVFPSDSPTINSSISTEARQLRLLGLSLVPSNEFRTSHANQSYGYQPNVRMLCARADVVSAAAPGPFAAVSFSVICATLVAGLVTML